MFPSTVVSGDNVTFPGHRAMVAPDSGGLHDMWVPVNLGLLSLVVESCGLEVMLAAMLAAMLRLHVVLCLHAMLHL